MSRFDECMAEIRKAADGAMSDEEILDMLEEMDSVARATAEQRPWANVSEELFGHAERLAKQAHESALIKERNKLLNQRRGEALRTFADDPAWKKDPAAAPTARAFGAFGFEAKGGKASVHRQGVALGRFWIGSLENALAKEDLFRAVRGGALDERIAMEMWELGQPTGGRPGISGSKEAQAAARIIHRLQEAMVSRLNRAGAYIKRLPGYIVRQAHDQRRITQAGFERWYAATHPKVDELKTFNRALESTEREKVYRSLFNEFAAGRHPSAIGEQAYDAFIPKGGNLAKRVSSHRELHFKTGKDWHDYHRQFGRGTLLEAVAQSAQSNGRAAALMEGFGTNPEAMLRRWVTEQDDKAVAIGAKTSEAKFRFSADTLWAVTSGEGNRPADSALARLGNGLRSWQVASKLGSAVITSYLTDPKLQGMELARHGVPFMRRALIPFQNVMRLAGETGEQRRLANMLQAYRDGMLSELWGRWDTGDGVPGAVSWMARKTMKWTGMQRWTDVSRGNVVGVISHEMAEKTGTKWAALDGTYRRMLEAYAITEQDWGRLGSALIDVEGNSYVVPHQLKLGDFGDPSTPEGRRVARRGRDELATKLITFMDDRMAAALNEPGARTRASVIGSTRPGTLDGEFRRAIGLFRSFPIELYTRVYGEKLAHGEIPALGVMILTMSVLGVANNIARDALRGIAPPDFENMTPGEAMQFFFRGMLSGGGMGLAADYVLGEYNRYGGTLSSTALGPVFGQMDTAAAIYAGLIHGDDVAAKSLRAVYTNVPFVNVWFARTMLDYYVLYPMQEWLNPGAVARMERKREKDTGQRYILSPSEAVGR